MRRRASGACRLLVCAILVAHPAAAQTPAAIDATAGIGGIVRAGRWAPVRVSIEGFASVDPAEIVVTWGESEARREITIADAGKRRFEVYVRSRDAGPSVRARLVAAGRELAATEIPVRIVPVSAPVTICIAAVPLLIADTSGCSATVPPDLLPQAARGYDAVDRLVWMTGGEGLTADQRSASSAWQSLHQLEQRGDLSFTTQVSRPTVRRGLPSTTARMLVAFAAVYLAAVMFIGFALASRLSLARVSLALTVATAAACAAAWTIGHRGPAREIRVHHATLLQQLPGTAASVVTIRGFAEFPAFDTFALRLPMADAVMERPGAGGGVEHLVDHEGFPVLSGAFGMGARQAFAAEGTAMVQPLAVSQNGSTLSVTNRSMFELRECRFGDGFARGEAADLQPGESMTAEHLGDGIGPAVTCMFDGSALEFTEPRRPVTSIGMTTVAAYFRWPANGNAVE